MELDAYLTATPRRPIASGIFLNNKAGLNQSYQKFHVDFKYNVNTKNILRINKIPMSLCYWLCGL